MRYQANPVVVDAFKIEMVAPIHEGGYQLFLEDKRYVQATPEMCSRMTPKAGDYWVIQSDGYTYLNPKEVFERKYGPVEMNAFELGAAARRAGIA